MQINITARHLDVDERFKAYAGEKLDRLNRYSNKIEEARVVFSMEKFTYVSEITLTGKNFRMIAVERGEELKGSFDKCAANIEKQLGKFHGRLKDHKVRRLLAGFYKKLSFKKAKEKMDQPQIIKTELTTAKPMSAEEAVLELELFKREFIVFRNSQSEEINVLYRRKDGNYGLIEQ